MKLSSPEVNKLRHHLVISVATLFLVLISVVMLPMSPQHAYQLDLPGKAVLYAAQLGGVPFDRLAVANTAWLGKDIFRAKVVDMTTGQIYAVSLHPSGEPATDEEVKEFLKAGFEKGFVGKVESSLNERVNADPTGRSTVCIWVKTPEPPRERWRELLASGMREQVFAEARDFHDRPRRRCFVLFALEQ